MEAQSPLVWAYSAIELHSVADVNMHLAFVVHPRHTEGKHALWLYDALDDLCLLEFRMLVIYILYRQEHFSHCLQILQFAWVLLLQLLHNFFHFHNDRFFNCFNNLSLCNRIAANLDCFCQTSKLFRVIFGLQSYILLNIPFIQHFLNLYALFFLPCQAVFQHICSLSEVSRLSPPLSFLRRC